MRTVLAVGLFLTTASVFGQLGTSWPCADELKRSQGVKQIVPVSAGVSVGLVRKKVLPDISDLKHSKTKSDVAVRIAIGKDGMVLCAEAEEGDNDLWARSVDAAKQWQFKPYMLNGEPVIIQTMIEFSFNKSKVSARFD